MLHMKHLKFLFGLFIIMTVLARTSKALFLTFSTSSRLQTLRVGVRFVSSAINEPDYISKNVVIKKEELPAANNIVSKKPINNNNNQKKDVNLEDNVKVKQKIMLLEKDLDEKFVRGSGNGGQKINTTANRVQLTHIPTGISVSCQDARDLSTNRKIARKTLIDKLDLHFNGSDSKLGIAHKKIRKKKKNAKRRAKKKYASASTATSSSSAHQEEEEEDFEEEDDDDSEDSGEGGDVAITDNRDLPNTTST